MDLPRPTTLLLADDDPFMLSRLPGLILERFQGQDLRVVTRRDAVSAFEAIAGEATDRRLVVLADHDLGPGPTGALLLEEVAAKRPEAMRLLYSAHSRTELEVDIARAQAHGFLDKPLRIDDLIPPLAAFLALKRNPPALQPPAAPPPPASPPAPKASGATHSRASPMPRVDDWGPPDDAYRRLVMSIRDYAVFMLDPQGYVRSWNLGAQRMKGYAPTEIIGKHFSVFYPPNDLAGHKPQFELKIASREGAFEDTGWRVRKDGTMFWANVVITAIRDPDGTLQGFAKVTRDLTDRKHSEEALRQSEERYRLLIQSVKDYAIFMLDPQGRITSWNEGAQRIKGYAAEEIIGEHFSIFYGEEDRARGHPANELRIAVREGRYEEEGWRFRKDGTRFWANVVITPLFAAGGEHRGFAKVTRDLTQRKKDEERLRAQAKEYEEISRELESFGYTVAHDLRAPLRAVIHLADVLVRDEQKISLQERREIIETLRGSAERMGQLVEDLLNLSRAGKGSFQSVPVDLSALVEDVARRLPSPPKREGVRLVVTPGMEAQGDPRLLRILLENLLSNAYKFTRKVENPTIEFGVREDKGQRVYFLRDNGIGFDPAQAHRLFRPFQRLHHVNEYEGTGIGLATVQRIVQRHGGVVWAEGAPGKGAMISFTLAPQP